MDFLQQFTAARRVSTPLIAVRTFDAKSTTKLIAGTFEASERKTTPMLLWDAMHGLTALSVGQQIDKDAQKTFLDGKDPLAVAQLAAMLEAIEKDTVQDAIIFVANAHLFWKNDPTVVQGIWNLRDPYKMSGNMLVLMTVPGANLPVELQNDVLVLDEPLPTEAELQSIVKNTYKFAKVGEPSPEIIASATDALVGLPGFASEQAAAMCLSIVDKDDTKKRRGELDIPELWDRKRQIINEAPGLSVYTGKEKLDDIGGVKSAKEFLTAVMTGTKPPKTIIFIDEIEKAFAGTGTDLSGTKTELTGSMLSWMQDKQIDGTILIGIPGVSKSALAKALGGSFGVPVINFDLAGMQGSLVGESGANLRAAQATVDAISGGSVLAIATCNGIESIPPELRRRFNLATFFFDAPQADERAAIWAIHRKKYNISDKDPTQITIDDSKWTGAEIEQCCLKASRLRWTLAQSATYIVPIAISSKDRIDKTRRDASGKYLSASLPGIYDFTETEEKKPGLNPPNLEGRKMRN